MTHSNNSTDLKEEEERSNDQMENAAPTRTDSSLTPRFDKKSTSGACGNIEVYSAAYCHLCCPRGKSVFIRTNKQSIMRGLMPSCDVKATAVEEGFETGEIRSDRFNVFKWFITANVILLIIFCGYALWSLYQLDNVMRSREEALSLQKYYASRKVNDQVNNALDFQVWKKSILENLQGDSKTNDSYGNLKVLLRNIGNIVESKKSKLIVANLTDQEVQALKEFTRFRYPRTIVGGPDESECDLQFSVTVTNNNEPAKVYLKPASKGGGMVNIKTTTNYMKNAQVESDIRECSFNIVYQPKNQDENAI